MENNESLKKKQSLLELILAITLSFIGGFIELYSLQVHGIFAGMQTGNLIQAFIFLSDSQFTLALYRFLLIGVFFIACLLAELLKLVLEKRNKRIELVILIAQLCMLLPLFFIKVAPYNDEPKPLNIVADIFLTAFSAFQYMTFKEMHGHTYATTMMTNLLSNIAKNLVDFFKLKDKRNGRTCLDLLAILICFILGALTAYLILKAIKSASAEYISLILFLPAALIVISGVIAYFRYCKKQKE